MKNTYKHVPGRGLMNQTAFDLRMDYLDGLVKDIETDVQSETISLSQIQNNIESYIGTVEIPLGLIGPLLYVEGERTDWVHTAVATTEGALVASMNRGAKAISESGGFKAHLVHQKMLRTPMFTFSNMSEALRFDEWIKDKFHHIVEQTSRHSNHAVLKEISSVIVGKIVHLKFIYSTSDASGQNMTTSCTWNACLWIEENFERETGTEILHFVIDGNGASDKKVSFYSMQNGRGVHVISEAFLSHEVLEKTLRTNAEDMFRSFNYSMAISRMDGMIGYNINVANAIAGIFGATGQDLASIHESSTAILQMELVEGGLYLSLSLPNLVVGTVGGGTHLPVASKILELMGCKGSGKVERFAKMIAGFALSIEVSTLAAIVSGQFARAHQKLGRNKPVQWLLKSEIDKAFVQEMTKGRGLDISEIQHPSKEGLENGIITQLTQKVSKKLVGFIPLDLKEPNGKTHRVLLKSKPLDQEVLDGLHFMASNINSGLADQLNNHSASLEYRGSHHKETTLYRHLESQGFEHIPGFYGSYTDSKREVYTLLMERISAADMEVWNSENEPSKWTQSRILSVVKAMHSFQANNPLDGEPLLGVQEFMFEPNHALYQQFTEVNRRDYEYLDQDDRFERMTQWEISTSHYTPKTLIHNDFNPRNTGIRKGGSPVVYDWELAVYDLPQRDLFEFLSFVLEEKFDTTDLLEPLKYHHSLMEVSTPLNWDEYLSDLQTAGRQYILGRVNFYLSGSTLVQYPFAERIFKTAHRMLDRIQEQRLNKAS